MSKGSWRRPESVGATLAPTMVAGALPGRCPQMEFFEPWGPHPVMQPCDGAVNRMAMRVHEPGIVGAKCARCGQVYLAKEDA